MLFIGIENAAETPGEESPFERRLLRAAGCRGMRRRRRGRIRRVFDDWFGDACKIVDYHHATEYAWAVACARHGGLAKAWAKKLCGMLKASRLGDVLDDLR